MRKSESGGCDFDNVLLFDCTTLPRPLPAREGGKSKASWKGKEKGRELSTDYADESRVFKRKYKEKKITWIYRMNRIRSRDKRSRVWMSMRDSILTDY